MSYFEIFFILENYLKIRFEKKKQIKQEKITTVEMSDVSYWNTRMQLNFFLNNSDKILDFYFYFRTNIAIVFIAFKIIVIIQNILNKLNKL